jgi:Yip1 domain
MRLIITNDPSHRTPEGDPMSMIDRIKNILMSPKTEWPTIAGETTSTQALYTGYIMILSAIGPIAMLLRGIVGAASAIGSYVVSLILLYVVALIVDVLAPTFGGEKNTLQSLKLVAYSSTAAWLAGIFHLLGPLFGLLSLVALIYSLYTFYLGVTVMKKVPAEKAVTYTVVVVVCVIVLGVLIGSVMQMTAFGSMGY